MANFQVNLLFKADTTAATNNIQQLGSLLTDISTKTKIGVDNGSLSQAVTSAQQLSIHLQNAMNQNTGKLDLSKLNASLKSAGTDLQTLTTQLRGAGPAGEQAFIKVATAVASAEAPMIRINQRLKDFGVTLVNTVKWQVASTAIHGISGMLSSAVGHAEDLNKALNDIRIVTGYGVDTMSQFAVEASNAARELSTTTTEYAKAALIFYQQGLNGDAVTERANVVVKLSQVTRQSAEQVSSQMTAIWNNFDDGTKSLEYYADALTKLGAATAASTDEISDGLEKFAAIAETVGLSYEYAAAAVATVIDKTRQSADVVGTAFKTIFARMQGLSLGDTLEDGVDLNKYSEALEKVGVDVLTAEGELRDMDDILSDLGEKWQGFGKETKVALAQTVAGVRQYNQMISLMDNWDSVKENIDLAKDATGELTKQQEIWSESYEAAANRVKQAQNELYEKFINDKSIVRLNDIFAQLIQTVGGVIDKMGGILPMVLTFAGVFSKHLFPLLQSGFKQLANNIAVITGKATQDLVLMQNSMRLQMQDTMSQAGLSDSIKQQISLSENLLVAKQKLTLASKNMSAAELEEAQSRMQVYESLVAETQQALQRQAQLEREIALQRESLTTGTNKKNLAENAARNDFHKWHGSMSGEYVDEIFDEATTFTPREIQQQQQQSQQRFADRKASINAQLEDARTIPTSEKFPETARAEAVKALLAELDAVEEEEQAQIERYKLIEEMQSRIAGQKRKKGEDIAVGTTETYTDAMETEHGASMTAKAVSDIGGSADDGLIEVDASISNLEALYQKMGEYNTQANTMGTMAKELNSTFMSTDGSLNANVLALQNSVGAMGEYQSATEAVDQAQSEYDAAVRKVTEAQQAAQKAGKKDAQATKNLADAKADLQKKEEQLASAQSKQKAALDKGTNAGQNYVKQLISMKGALIQAAQSAGGAQDDIDKINKAFEDLGSGDAQKAAQGLQTIQEQMLKFQSGSSEAVAGLDNIAAAIQERLLGSGMNPAQLQAFIDNLVKMGVISPDIANKLRIVGDAGANLGPRVKSGADLAIAGISAMATAAGQLSMAVSGIQMFIGAFEEGLSPMQRFAQIMGSLPMILGAVGAAIKLVNGLKERHTLITSGTTAATLAQKAAENELILSEGALTAVTWVTTAAQWAWNAAKAFGMALTGKYGAVALAAAAAVAVMGVAVAIGAAKQKKANQELSEAQREQNEATIEQTEKTNALTNAWADQMSVMDELIAKYEALRRAGGDYGEATEDIINAVPEVIDAYNELAEGLDLNPEQLEKFNELIKEMRQGAAQGGEEGVAAIQQAQSEMDALLSPEASAAAKEGAKAAMSQTAQAIVDVGDAKWENNQVTRHVGGIATQFRSFYDDDGNLLAANEEDAAGKLLEKHGVGTQDSVGEGYNVALDTSSTENFVKDYESLLAAQKEMENVLGDAVDDSDTYREISDMLKASEEEYQKLAGLQAEAEKFGAIDAKVALEEQGKTLEGIDSYGAYDGYKTALVKQMQTDNPEMSAEEAEAAADAWLRAQGAVEEYVEAEDKMGFAASKAADEAERQAIAQGKSTEEAEAAGKAAEDARMKELEDLYAELDDEEDRTFFMNVDFNKYESKAAIKAEIERLQNVAEGEKIQLKIDKITSAQSTLKEDGMSTEDWSKIQNETLTWGEEGIISFNEFLNMTYEQQSQYLADQMQASQNAFIATKQAAVDELKSSPDPEISQEEQSSIQAEIDALEAELAIAEKIRQERWETAFEARSEALGLESEAVNAYADSLLEMAETGELVSEDLQDQTNASKILAQNIQRMNKGVSDLGDNWKDYTKALNPNKKLTAEYAKSMSALRGNVEDILDLDMTNFSDGWFESTENMKLFESIAKGDMTAIDDLRLAASEEILFQAGLDTTEAETHAASLMDTLESIPDLKIGTTVDISQAAGSLWDLYEAGEITAQGLQEALNGIGWEPQIEYDTMTVAEAKQHGQTAEVLMADGSIATVDLNNYASDTTVLRIPRLSSSKATYRGGGSVAQPPAMDNSGGGGGSKPKLKNDSDKTRYHTLENQLEDLKSEYEDISDAADRAFGKDKLKLMDEQIAKTDELIDKQEEYVAAIAADLPKDKAVMEAYYDDLIGGPTMEFDENGNIANYDAIQDAMYAMYNENAENMSAEDWEIFEQKYEQLEKYIEQYEETYDMLRDEEQGLQDLVNQRLDQELAKIQYTIELKLNVADDALEVLEYQLSQLEDDAFAAAEAIALLGDKAGLLQDKMAAARQGIDSILGQSLSSSEIELFMSGDTSVLEGKTFTEEQMNQLRDYRSELLSLNEELLQIREDVQSKVMDTFDAWNEKLQKGIDKFDHYSSVLTSYKNIVDLVGKSYLGVDNELLKSMNDAMIENSINKVGATRAAYEALLESQANAQAQYEAAVASGNENDIKFWADTLETIGEEVDAAQENMMAAWEESLQLAAEEFQRQVDIALEEFNIALTGFASMEEFRENFDFAKEVEEEYVPAYEKIYELSKLNRDINKTLNDDRVIKGKEKLLELQEKINQYQQDGVEMSEYEIANLQREYDLRMAEIALEEARNAKDTVRMSKDNEGNWSYVYTTNTEAVDTAQQEYEDALFAMQQANDEYLDEMSNLILDATQRMNEEIAALRLEDFANQQEYDAAVQAITDKYMGRIKYGQEQMQLAINNNADLYQNDWTAYSEATGYKIATDEEYVDSFNETVLGKLLNSESQVVNVYDMINDQIGGLLEATSGAYADWSGQVDAANQAAGTSTDNFAEDMNNAINGPGGISESSGDAADSVYDMAEDMIEDFDRVAQAVSDWQRSYSNDIDTIIEKNLDAIEVCNALLAVLSDVQDVDLSNLTPTYDPYGKTYDNTTNSKDKDEEVVVVPVEQRGGNTTNPSGGGGREFGIDTLSWREEASVPHFASGGYTGEWGDDGRLAVLHQKELVLNAEDTTNMFKALNLTRQILDTIDLNAQYASGGLGQVMASSIRDAITQTLEQHVTIEADFPSVADHNEIEIAMKNLINTASQFAHRK